MPAPRERTSGAAGCVGCVALPIAVAATAACLGLIHVGRVNHWSSDGPGMLFVMIGILVTGGVALPAWQAVLGALMERD